MNILSCFHTTPNLQLMQISHGNIYLLDFLMPTLWAAFTLASFILNITIYHVNNAWDFTCLTHSHFHTNLTSHDFALIILNYIQIVGLDIRYECLNNAWNLNSKMRVIFTLTSLSMTLPSLYVVKAQTSLAPLSRFRGSRVTTAHAHQCCIFRSYAKTVPSRIKLTMNLTMREPTFMGSMTTDHVITTCDVWL